MPKHFIYCRKSTESEERQVLSIESQETELLKLAEREGIKVDRIFKESKSAKEPGRPVFNEMVSEIEKEISGATLLVWKLDRLARNPVDEGKMKWLLQREVIREIKTYERDYLPDDNVLITAVEFGMANQYIRDLSANVKRGNRAKLEKGWLPNLPPLGYLNEPKERTIVRDAERFPLIRKMWDLLLQGVPVSIILSTANDKWGFRTRTHKKLGCKPLTSSGLYKIFSNPFYYGLIERRDGVFQGKHEPIITEEEFWKAQDILGKKGRPRPKEHHFAFTGLIRCGECGCMITAEEKTNRYGYHYTYYRCSKKKRDVKCLQKYINLKDLEIQILDELKRIQIPKNLFDIAMEHLKSEDSEENKTDMNVQVSLRNALADCQRKLDNLNQMRLKDLINDEEYLKEKKALLYQKIKLEASAEGGPKSGRSSIEAAQKTFHFALTSINYFQKRSLVDKKTIL